MSLDDTSSVVDDTEKPWEWVRECPGLSQGTWVSVKYPEKKIVYPRSLDFILRMIRENPESYRVETRRGEIYRVWVDAENVQDFSYATSSECAGARDGRRIEDNPIFQGITRAKAEEERYRESHRKNRSPPVAQNLLLRLRRTSLRLTES